MAGAPGPARPAPAGYSVKEVVIGVSACHGSSTESVRTDDRPALQPLFSSINGARGKCPLPQRPAWKLMAPWTVDSQWSCRCLDNSHRAKDCPGPFLRPSRHRGWVQALLTAWTHGSLPGDLLTRLCAPTAPSAGLVLGARTSASRTAPGVCDIIVAFLLLELFVLLLLGLRSSVFILLNRRHLPWLQQSLDWKLGGIWSFP